MNRKTLIIGALAVAGALSAGIAQARSDVQWSVTIGAPIGVPIYSQPYPVYNHPYPVYNHPYPVYSQPYPVYTQPYPVYTRPAPVVHYPAYPRGYYPSAYGDRDRDGIPNHRDRVYNPRWDRDGDGVPNRYDRDDRYANDRDHDGIPNWQDRHDGRVGRR